MKGTKQEGLPLDRVYKWTILHTMLYSYVTGQIQNGATKSVAIHSFMEYFNVQDIDYNTLRHAYHVKCTELKKCMSGVSTELKSVFKGDEIDNKMAKIYNIVTDGR